MRAGAVLCLIAGIMECVLIYFFVWYTYVDGMTIYYASGWGLMNNLPYLFTNAPSIAAGMMLPLPVFYLIAILFIVVLASPILILIGIKRRSTAIIGSFMPLFLAAALLVGYFAFPIIFDGLYFMWDTVPLLYVSPAFQVTGLYLMGIGGIVSFIGGCLGRGPKVEVYKDRKQEDVASMQEPTVDLPKDPLRLRSLSFPLDYSDLPVETMKPEIDVPIDNSNAKKSHR